MIAIGDRIALLSLQGAVAESAPSPRTPAFAGTAQKLGQYHFLPPWTTLII